MIWDVLLAVTPPVGDPGVAESASAVAVKSVMDFVVKGGLMMIPIGICSLVALAVFLERTVSLRRSRIIPAKFLAGLKNVLRTAPDDRKKAIEYCEKDGSPVARVFAAGMKKLGAPIEVMEKHIQEAGQREVLKLRKYVRALSVIASIAPLMGLLGTIFGMIKAFQTVATSAEALGKTELLAEGIYQAMLTTAAGLIVAIPVLVMYHWIAAKIDRLVMDIDLMTVEFIEGVGDERVSDAESIATQAVAAARPAATSPTTDSAPGAQVATT